MSDLRTQDFDKTLSLKLQEIESLKAQNGRLIERLQEEIDKSASATIQKEIIHKEIIQIHMTMREVYQQGQLKKSALEKIFSKINDFELRLQEQQKTAATKYAQYISTAIAEEMEQLKLEIFKTQSKETNIERLLLETNEKIQEQKQQLRSAQVVINTILKRQLKSSGIDIPAYIKNESSEGTGTSNAFAAGLSTSVAPPSVEQNIAAQQDENYISAADMQKIEYELKNELSTNPDDLNLIFQMLNEKNDIPLDR